MLASDVDPDVSGGPFAFGPQRVKGEGPFTGQELMGSDDPVDDPHLRHPEFFRPRQAETEEEDVELAEDSCLPSDNIQGNCSTFVSNRWN